MAAVEEDPTQVRAAQILVSLRYRKLRRWPEWVPMQPGEASSSPGTVATEVMRPGEASSAAGTVAARVPLRRLPERVSVQSGEASLAGTVAAGVPDRWPKGKRSRSRGETSRELEQGHAAAAAAGSGARCSEEERYAEMLAASAQRPVVAAALCYVAAAESGPSTSARDKASAAALAKERMKTSSPDTPLDYGAGGSGAPSSADDAAPARPQAKRKGTGARGSVGGASGGRGDDEGCSSPAKRGPVAEEEKPMPISAEPSMQSETRASSGKGAPLPFDLNLPCPLDDDD